MRTKATLLDGIRVDHLYLVFTSPPMQDTVSLESKPTISLSSFRLPGSQLWTEFAEQNRVSGSHGTILGTGRELLTNCLSFEVNAEDFLPRSPACIQLGRWPFVAQTIIL